MQVFGTLVQVFFFFFEAKIFSYQCISLIDRLPISQWNLLFLKRRVKPLLTVNRGYAYAYTFLSVRTILPRFKRSCGIDWKSIQMLLLCWKLITVGWLIMANIIFPVGMPRRALYSSLVIRGQMYWKQMTVG